MTFTASFLHARRSTLRGRWLALARRAMLKKSRHVVAKDTSRAISVVRSSGRRLSRRADQSAGTTDLRYVSPDKGTAMVGCTHAPGNLAGAHDSMNGSLSDSARPISRQHTDRKSAPRGLGVPIRWRSGPWQQQMASSPWTEEGTWLTSHR
jgi:hypothetical protein